MPSSARGAIRRNLLRWYHRHKRDLPWRRSRDPYAIWIAETMLQQTQVKTVIPYYEKFLEAFPTVEHLARAPRRQVLRRWTGLGYYRRAENLHKAAGQILRRHGGALPAEPAALKALAGIGEYTAGALLSIAFAHPYPAVDGNVRRVLGRLYRFGDPRQAQRAAALLVPEAKPGDFNQALMELGATVCTPKNPRCIDCPLRSHCATAHRPPPVAASHGRRRRRVIDVVWPLVIVQRGAKVLLRRRPGHGVLAGLWEIPGGELQRSEPIADALARQLPSLAKSLKLATQIGVIRHAITHRRIRAPVFLVAAGADWGATSRRNAGWRWVDPARLDEQATSSMTVKAVRLLSSHEKNTR